MSARPRHGARVVAWLVVIAAGIFFFKTPLEVRLLERRLASTDPMERASARQRLLAIGRPAIDPVYPGLVAGEIEDELTNVIGVAVVTSGDDVETVLLRHPDFPVEALGVAPVGSPTCPTARALGRERAPRELRVVAIRKKGDAPELRVHVPLDPEAAEPVLAAVRAKLTRR